MLQDKRTRQSFKMLDLSNLKMPSLKTTLTGINLIWLQNNKNND